MIQMQSQSGKVLKHASTELRNTEIVMCTLSQDRLPLQHASLELRGDREVVMAAVAEHGYALEFCFRGPER